jgi:hypothetical protein
MFGIRVVRLGDMESWSSHRWLLLWTRSALELGLALAGLEGGGCRAYHDVRSEHLDVRFDYHLG